MSTAGMKYLIEQKNKVLKEHRYIHKETKEEHSFRRTNLNMFVREADDRSFSPQGLGRQYDPAPPKKFAPSPDSWRVCFKCDDDEPKPPEAFYKSVQGRNNICRSCVLAANAVRKQERRTAMLRERQEEKARR